MLKYFKTSDAVASAIRDAANATIRDFKDQALTEEPSFTDRFLVRPVDNINSLAPDQLKWTAKTIPTRRLRMERRTGADFAGVLQIQLPAFSLTKGFLAQAKILRSGSLVTNEQKRLISQCEKMLRITPDSFVFLYSFRDVTIVPASSVVATGSLGPEYLVSRSVHRFFIDYLTCFIGDRRIAGLSDQEILRVIEQAEARTAFVLRATLAGYDHTSV